MSQSQRLRWPAARPVKCKALPQLLLAGAYTDHNEFCSDELETEAWVFSCCEAEDQDFRSRAVRVEKGPLSLCVLRVAGHFLWVQGQGSPSELMESMESVVQAAVKPPG